MTLLRLVPVSGTTVDAALAEADGVTLTRRSGAVYVESRPQHVIGLIRALAFAGVEARPCEVVRPPDAGLLAAVGRDLAPLPAAAGIDIVHVRPLTFGQASREILHRRCVGLLGPSDAARARCRAVLRGGEVVLAWDRTAFVSRDAIRRAGRSLRPVVFDRGAAERSELGGRTFASEGAISRWLFG